MVVCNRSTKTLEVKLFYATMLHKYKIEMCSCRLLIEGFCGSMYSDLSTVTTRDAGMTGKQSTYWTNVIISILVSKLI